MSLYQVHKLIHDRMGRFSRGEDTTLDLAGWDLTEHERAVVSGDDIAGLYAMGLHPVLLNGYCRTLGLRRDDYRELLAPYRQPDTRRPRWRSS